MEPTNLGTKIEGRDMVKVMCEYVCELVLSV